MDFERIFSKGGALGIFPKFFQGAKSGEICFFPLKIKKTTFFVEIFKIQGGQGAFDPLLMHMDAAQRW